MKIVKAKFQDGVFLPLTPLSLPNGTTARVEFDSFDNDKPWMRFCGSIPKHETDQMMAAIEEAFEQVSLDDWK